MQSRMDEKPRAREKERCTVIGINFDRVGSESFPVRV